MIDLVTQWSHFRPLKHLSVFHWFLELCLLPVSQYSPSSLQGPKRSQELAVGKVQPLCSSPHLAQEPWWCWATRSALPPHQHLSPSPLNFNQTSQSSGQCPRLSAAREERLPTLAIKMQLSAITSLHGHLGWPGLWCGATGVRLSPLVFILNFLSSKQLQAKCSKW